MEVFVIDFEGKSWYGGGLATVVLGGWMLGVFWAAEFICEIPRDGREDTVMEN